MGFAGRPASHATSSSKTSRVGSAVRSIGGVSMTSSGKVRVHRRKKHAKGTHARIPRIYSEMVRDMMETNRAMRYAMIARATR